jgi:putative endonuclease
MAYSLYILRCADGTYYTGIATDVQRRLLEHNGLTRAQAASGEALTGKAKGRGARYTSARRPVTLVYEAGFASQSEALKAEARLKRLSRSQKEALIGSARIRPGRAP